MTDITKLFAMALAVALSACARSTGDRLSTGVEAPAAPHGATSLTGAAPGNAQADRDVFRFETFGNEGFWTDAMRLPQRAFLRGLGAGGAALSSASTR